MANSLFLVSFPCSCVGTPINFSINNMSEINRTELFGKLNSLLYRSLEGATAFCKLRGHPYVELVHWLHQIMHEHDSDFQKIIKYFELKADDLERGIVAALAELPGGASSISDFNASHLNDLTAFAGFAASPLIIAWNFVELISE